MSEVKSYAPSRDILKSSTDKQVSEIDALQDMFTQRIGSVYELTRRLDHVSDRVFGSIPEAGKDGGKAGAPADSCLGRLRDTVAYFDANLDALRAVTMRLERL
jgi:hypothetical protein